MEKFSKDPIPGVYCSKTKGGLNLLSLNEDSTYYYYFISNRDTLINEGRWRWFQESTSDVVLYMWRTLDPSIEEYCHSCSIESFIKKRKRLIFSVDDDDINYKKCTMSLPQSMKSQQIKQLEENINNETDSLKPEKKSGILHIKQLEGNIKKEADNLKFEYKRRFGKPITDFEHSIISMSFETGTYDITHGYNTEGIVSINKIGENVFAEYRNKYKIQTIELDIREWLDFINTLYGYRIDEWQTGHYKGPEPSTKEWKLTIFFSDKESCSFFGLSGPPNWNKFIKVIDDMEAKIKNRQIKQLEENIKKEADDNLKVEYKKRYGRSITNFELSIVNISFEIRMRSSEPSRNISITRTTNCPIMEHSKYKKLVGMVDVEEWLYFINALYNYHHKWEKISSEEYSELSDFDQVFSCFDCDVRILTVFFSNRERIKYVDTDNSGWYNSLVKAVDNVEAKIRDAAPSACPQGK